MGAYKQLLAQDIIITPFEVNKSFTFNGASQLTGSNVGIDRFIGKNLTSSYQGNIDIFNPKPSNAYGKSKLQADLSIQKLQSNDFNVAIIRMPMIYGKNAKGNFLDLVKISKKLSIFPRITNKRSVLHIKNLSELIRLIIVNKLSGLFFPQDHNFFNTTEFIFKTRTFYRKKTFLIPLLSIPLRFFGFFIKSINKIYGNKFYDSSLSIIKNINYQIYSIDDVIEELKDI